MKKKNISLKRFVGVSDRTTEGVLGVIVSYTIGDMRVPRDALEEAFEKYNIPKDYLPNEIRATDAFRKASKSIEDKQKVYNEKGELIYQRSILVRDLLFSQTMNIRKIVEEVRDVKSRKLIYDADVGNITFYKKNNTLKVDIIRDEYSFLKDLLEERYQEFLNFYDGNRIRYMVRQFLMDREPIIVRPHGGTYFIPAKYQDEVERLGEMINDLASRFAASLWDTIYIVTPFVDIEKNRELLKLRWDLFVKNKCLELYEEISKLMEEGKYDRETARRYEQEINKLIESTRRYEDILQKQLTETKDILNKLRMSGTTTQFAKVAESLKGILRPRL